MALSDNPYIDLPLATIQSMQTQWLQVMSDIAAGGKSYSFPGRSFSRADVPQVRETLSDLRTAIRYSTGKGRTSAQVRINTQSEFSA